MAVLRWIGGAAPIAQVRAWTIAGTWVVGETVTITIGSKQYVYTLASATIATWLAALVAVYNALSATTYPELLELTATNTSTTFVLTANTAGKPFAMTFSTNSGAGTINGSSSSAGTETTANSGPNDWGTAKNWLTTTGTNVVPVSTDTVNLDYSDDDIKYGLAQSAVTLTALNIASTFTGTLGLPKFNNDGVEYPEYRTDYLQIGATTVNIGTGQGQGSQRIKHDAGSVACTWTVLNSSNGAETDLEAVLLKGTNAANVLSVVKGSVGVAVFGGEAANLSGALNVGYQTSLTSDSQVRTGLGVTLGTINQSGGQLVVNTACTLNMSNGNTTVNGTGATTATVQGGVLVYNSSGTLTGVVGQGGFIDMDQVQTPFTVATPLVLYNFPGFQDTFKRAGAIVCDYKQVNVPPFGINVRLTRGTPAAN